MRSDVRRVRRRDSVSAAHVPAVRLLCRVLVVLAIALAPFGETNAQSPEGEASQGAGEPTLLSLEGGAAFALTAPQNDLFGPGLQGALAVHHPVAPAVLLGARLRGGFLFDGPAPRDPRLADPGTGTFSQLHLSLRLRPLGNREDVRRGVGLWLELGGGATMTGNVRFRGSWEAGVGYGFAIGGIDLSPVVRFVHVLQPDAQVEGRDAHLLLAGLELTLFDARPVEVVEEPPEEQPQDSDLDGLLDPDDACPFEPEDADGFEDEDGCPDPDNDEDTILDVDDDCPLEPEDMDDWADADGCPDLDNDGDGFADVNDRCPNEPEVVNGIEDWDGCPDEGLIALHDDRIILEERVLFEFERARIKSSARPVLRAIAEMVQQHPEWASMRIEGHADVRGDEAFNQRLSERRARNVMRELIDDGVDAGSIESVGFGSRRARDLGRDEDAHQRNRRVEFVVVTRHAALPQYLQPPAVEVVEGDESGADAQAEDAAGADSQEDSTVSEETSDGDSGVSESGDPPPEADATASGTDDPEADATASDAADGTGDAEADATANEAEPEPEGSDELAEEQPGEDAESPVSSVQAAGGGPEAGDDAPVVPEETESAPGRAEVGE